MDLVVHIPGSGPAVGSSLGARQKVWARSGMQVSGRSSGVIRSYSGDLLSLAVQVGGMMADRRLGEVIWSYSGGLLSLAMLEGGSR